MKFAAFIMTYEREAILLNTINTIFSQTYPPEKILIIDNSLTTNTCKLIQTLANSKVKYHSVGYNSGPAGAAAIGLKILANEGYDWIYWGDDDDPPIFEHVFEILLKTAMANSNCGCVGSVGQFFNTKTGFIERVPNEMLQSEGFLKVDTVAGGMSKIVNGRMVKSLNIVPCEKLFFSFEELDFDIRVRKAGYVLLVDKSLYWRHRENAGRVNYKRDYLSKCDIAKFWRKYYSIRNLLYICYSNKFYMATSMQILISLLKPFYNLRYGFNYFRKSAMISFLAVYHFVINKFGYIKFQ